MWRTPSARDRLKEREGFPDIDLVLVEFEPNQRTEHLRRKRQTDITRLPAILNHEMLSTLRRVHVVAQCKPLPIRLNL